MSGLFRINKRDELPPAGNCGICGVPVQVHFKAFGFLWCVACVASLELHTIKEGLPGEPENRGMPR